MLEGVRNDRGSNYQNIPSQSQSQHDSDEDGGSCYSRIMN